MSQKTLLSASVPSGIFTLGNYIGAMKQWLALLDQYHSYFMVADLHSITTQQDPKLLVERTYSFLAQYLACGLDPDKNIVFLQSHVSEHAELAWVLSCNTSMGQLNRMTQFKDKSQSHADNINAGLFTYPVLMASDILLYDANVIPVGEDQKQHLELTRDLAERFNGRFGKTFVMPEPFIPKTGARIMSLQDPTKKMSKSDANANNYIALLDDPKLVLKKFKSSVTDSGTEVKFDESKAGIANLITIYASIANISIPEVEARFAGKMYGHLKIELAELTNEFLKPIQERYTHYMNDRAGLDSIMKKNALLAKERASKTLRRVYDATGFIPKGF